MADGAGAVVLDGSDRGRMWTDLGVDGSLTGILYADHGGTMHMQGREVFRNAVRACAASCERVVGEAGYRFEDVDLFVPHQANRRIIDAVAERLGIEESRCAITVDTTGNTSAASIPIALAAASAAGRVSDGDLVLLSGFGAGMTWASALLRW
jgi:3-oxoacyl-[acyl-carrier-protein] synthase-3